MVNGPIEGGICGRDKRENDLLCSKFYMEKKMTSNIYNLNNYTTYSYNFRYSSINCSLASYYKLLRTNCKKIISISCHKPIPLPLNFYYTHKFTYKLIKEVKKFIKFKFISINKNNIFTDIYECLNQCNDEIKCDAIQIISDLTLNIKEECQIGKIQYFHEKETPKDMLFRHTYIKKNDICRYFEIKYPYRRFLYFEEFKSCILFTNYHYANKKINVCNKFQMKSLTDINSSQLKIIDKYIDYNTKIWMGNCRVIVKKLNITVERYNCSLNDNFKAITICIGPGEEFTQWTPWVYVGNDNLQRKKFCLFPNICSRNKIEKKRIKQNIVETIKLYKSKQHKSPVKLELFTSP